MSNREIKFRAWVISDEKMYNVKKMYLISNGYAPQWHIDTFHHKNLSYHQFKLMQFTGLLDKQGKEIYEGDILQLVDDAGNEIKVTCEFGIHKRKMDSGFLVEISGFAFISPTGMPTFPIIHNYAGKSDLDIMEIIGNIFQNPDLLNKNLLQ